MVSLQDSHSSSSTTRRLHSIHSFRYPPPPPSSSSKLWRENKGRSMRTIRSNLFSNDNTCPTSSPSAAAASKSGLVVSDDLTDSIVEIRLGELASRKPDSLNPSFADTDFLDFSHTTTLSDFSVCSSDISGELQRLATLAPPSDGRRTRGNDLDLESEPEPCLGFLQRENFSTEIIDGISPEDLQPTVKICVDGLRSQSVAVRRSAAAKIRMLAKNRSDNRVLIADSGAVPELVSLLRCSDPWTQEHAVTALLNLSLHHDNKMLITGAGAIKSLVYALKTGTEVSKQNAAAALMSLAMIDDNRLSIGACGAIPLLVSLLISGSSRGKKDALTTLYKLCSARLNKDRAVSAGAVRPLVELVVEQGTGMAEKAMVVLSSLAAIEEGRRAIVLEGGIPALVEAVEESSEKGKEFSVVTLLQLCADSVWNRGLLIREGGIPPLVALSQTGTVRAKQKAETLLGYLREQRQKG